jgi:hypothetical protein
MGDLSALLVRLCDLLLTFAIRTSAPKMQREPSVTERLRVSGLEQPPVTIVTDLLAVGKLVRLGARFCVCRPVMLIWSAARLHGCTAARLHGCTALRRG